jgi:5-methylcytosine-specific restriction endonuclease McrA
VLALVPAEPPSPRRTGPRETILAAVRRAVWARDQGRCRWPLDGGGVCGSTHRLEFDHVVPWARWGGETVDDLRVVCHAHNKLAARQAFGARCVERYTRKRRPRRDSA